MHFAHGNFINIHGNIHVCHSLWDETDDKAK